MKRDRSYLMIVDAGESFECAKCAHENGNQFACLGWINDTIKRLEAAHAQIIKEQAAK